MTAYLTGVTVVLWSAVVGLFVAAGQSDGHRGAFIAIGIIWFFLALGVTFLTVAIRRRERRS